MWIVKLALRRPYTFVVMAILMVVLGAAAISSMPVDIFPYINIPVVSVVWSYTGMSPTEMASRVTTISERAMTTTVNDIEHMACRRPAATASSCRSNGRRKWKRRLSISRWRHKTPLQKFANVSGDRSLALAALIGAASNPSPHRKWPARNTIANS